MIETSPFETAIQSVAQSNDNSIVSIELKKHPGISADTIEQAFAPMVTMLREFEAEYGVITSKPITEQTCEEAKKLRLKMVKIRTGTDKIHKDQKAYFLRGGRAIDAVKNILEGAVVDKEKALSDIENHFINIEKDRKMKLFDFRVSKLIQYISEVEAKMIPLGEMSEDAFNNLHNGYALAYEARIKADQAAEQKRIAEAEAKAIEEKQIREDNKMLIRLNERINQLSKVGFIWHETSTSYFNEHITMGIQKDKIFKMMDDEFEEYLFKASKMFSEFTSIENEKRKKADLIALENQRKFNEKFKKEQAERKRLEAEAKAKADQEEAERKQKLADERKLKRGPEKQRLMLWADNIDNLAQPFSEVIFNDNAANTIQQNAVALLLKVVKYIKDNAEKL